MSKIRLVLPLSNDPGKVESNFSLCEGQIRIPHVWMFFNAILNGFFFVVAKESSQYYFTCSSHRILCFLDSVEILSEGGCLEN